MNEDILDDEGSTPIAAAVGTHILEGEMLTPLTAAEHEKRKKLTYVHYSTASFNNESLISRLIACSLALAVRDGLSLHWDGRSLCVHPISPSAYGL